MTQASQQKYIDINKIKSSLSTTIKEEGVYLFIILLVFAGLSLIYFDKYIISNDNCRELLVFQMISQGKMIYKDFYFLYGPLSPCIFAVLIKLFGFNLTMFKLISFTIVLIYGYMLYFVSRFILDKQSSLLVSLLYFTMLAFNISSTYLFPYSYGALIGSFIYILLLFLLLNHFKTDKIIFINLALVCLIVIFFIKQDFFISSAGLYFSYLLVSAFNKISLENKSFKNIIKDYFQHINILNIVIRGLIMFSGILIIYLLLAMLVGLNNINFNIFAFQIYNSAPVKFFKNAIFHSNLNIENISGFLVSGIVVFIVLLVTLLLLYSFINAKDSLQKGTIYKNIIFWLACLLFIVAIFLCFNINTIILFVIYNLFSLFLGINLWIICLLLYCLMNLKDKKNLIVIIFCLGGLYLSFRSFLYLSLTVYTHFYLPVYLILFVYIFIEIMPLLFNKYFKVSRDKFIRPARSLMFIMILVYFILNIVTIKAAGLQVIKTPKGEFYTRGNEQFILSKEISQYIKENTTPNDSILHPIDYMVYFLSERFPASYIFDLCPPAIHTTDYEKQLLAEIKRKKPKYILISNLDLKDSYGVGLFGSSTYYPIIYDWILKNYDIVRVFESTEAKYKVDVYKINTAK